MGEEMIKNKHIFITDGAGFIANKLISKLIENNKIIIFDNFHKNILTRSIYTDHANLTVIKGNVLDYDKV